MKSAKPRMASRPSRLVVVVPRKNLVSETFIKAHLERLPFYVFARYSFQNAGETRRGIRVWVWGLLFRDAARWVWPRVNQAVSQRLLVWHLKSIKADAVLAEYGITGSWLTPLCAKAGLPLFVHFHGFDAWRAEVLNDHRASYRRMFAIAAGVIAVSEPMREQLLRLGAPPERLHLSLCGVDPDRFKGARPGEQPPHFLAVGRFVEKKAPYLTLLAFGQVLAAVPNASLTMVGDGPLLGPCKRLATALGLQHSVVFLGVQTSDQVAELMQQVRGFVQHSLQAEDGDCEGTPVAIIEAQMSGLPVVSTRHAGIPHVVIDAETGFLLDEADADGMGAAMRRLAESPALAGRLGQAARTRALAHFTLERHLGDLANIIAHRVQADADASLA